MSLNEVKEIQKNQYKGKKFAFIRYNMPKPHEFEIDDTITALTQAPNNGFIASADFRGLIKIWTQQRVLVREI